MMTAADLTKDPDLYLYENSMRRCNGLITTMTFENIKPSERCLSQSKTDTTDHNTPL